MATATATRHKPATRKAPKAQAERISHEQKLTETLIALLESGVNPWRKEWKAEPSFVPHQNLLTGHCYSGSNVALLAMQGMGGLPLWLGFSQAKERGWFPAKGSHGAIVLRPQVNQYDKLGEDGKPVVNPATDEVEKNVWTSFKGVYVFNAAALRGATEESEAELSALIKQRMGATETRPEAVRIAEAEAVLMSWPVPVTYGGDRACYWPAADRISMPEACSFSQPEAFYATLAHEATHSTGHRSRLARDLSGSFGSESYAREELVAEIGAYLICDRLQVQSCAENHAAYLGNWLSVLKESPKALMGVLGAASKAARLIVDGDATPATVD